MATHWPPSSNRPGGYSCPFCGRPSQKARSGSDGTRNPRRRLPSPPPPWIHLEFDIPRLGRRVDAVLVTQKCVIPIEFKVGAKKFERLDYEQAWDFRIDLKNFHAPSHSAAIFPILCAMEARDAPKR